MENNKKSKKKNKFGGFLALVLFSLVFSCVGLLVLQSTYKEQQALKDYSTTIGLVVDHEEKFDPADEDEYVSPYFSESYIYAPIVEYEVEGKWYEVTSDEFTRDPPLEGTPIEVSYDPNEPHKAVLNKTKGNIQGYLLGAVFTALGPVVFGIGFVANKKMKK